MLAPLIGTLPLHLGGGEVVKIERSIEDGEVEYEVDTVAASGKAGGLVVEADGTLSSIGVSLEDLPEPVRRTISQQVGAGNIQSIEKFMDGATHEYEVEVSSTAGRLDSFTVSAAGDLESITVPLDQLSSNAQATVKEKVGDGKIVEVRRIFKGNGKGKANGFPSEIYAMKNGAAYNFRVGPNGKFQGPIE